MSGWHYADKEFRPPTRWDKWAGIAVFCVLVFIAASC